MGDEESGVGVWQNDPAETTLKCGLGERKKDFPEKTVKK